MPMQKYQALAELLTLLLEPRFFRQPHAEPESHRCIVGEILCQSRERKCELKRIEAALPSLVALGNLNVSLAEVSDRVDGFGGWDRGNPKLQALSAGAQISHEQRDGPTQCVPVSNIGADNFTEPVGNLDSSRCGSDGREYSPRVFERSSFGLGQQVTQFGFFDFGQWV